MCMYTYIYMYILIYLFIHLYLLLYSYLYLYLCIYVVYTTSCHEQLMLTLYLVFPPHHVYLSICLKMSITILHDTRGKFVPKIDVAPSPAAVGQVPGMTIRHIHSLALYPTIDTKAGSGSELRILIRLAIAQIISDRMKCTYTSHERSSKETQRLISGL